MRPLFANVLSAALAASTLSAYSPLVSAEDARPAKVVFQDDFENGDDKWEYLDPKTWKLNTPSGESKNGSIEITERKSEYTPPTRSPGHVALVKDLEVGSFEIQFRVRSTLDTGNHRDCCVFFGYQNSAHFYYVHLGAKPDPHSGQIMIVNDAPRLALTTNEKLTPWDNDWHNVLLRRDVESGKIEIYFDDMETPHMSVVDKTFGAGRVGLGSFDDLNEFDDVVIREMD